MNKNEVGGYCKEHSPLPLDALDLQRKRAVLLAEPSNPTSRAQHPSPLLDAKRVFNQPVNPGLQFEALCVGAGAAAGGDGADRLHPHLLPEEERRHAPPVWDSHDAAQRVVKVSLHRVRQGSAHAVDFGSVKESRQDHHLDYNPAGGHGDDRTEAKNDWRERMVLRPLSTRGPSKS